jgi:hypothetical protein
MKPMQAESLVALMAPHGVDLERAHKMASREPPKPDVVPGKRRGSRVLVPPDQNRAAGRETRGLRRPEWSIQEIGMASQDLEEYAFRAALFAFAGARDHMRFLHRGLMGRARMFKMLYRWPDEVRSIHGFKQPYLENLCKLVLDEDTSPFYFRASQELYAAYMFVNQPEWEKELQPRYAELKWAWNDWLGLAARRIQARLSEMEEGTS